MPDAPAGLMAGDCLFAFTQSASGSTRTLADWPALASTAGGCSDRRPRRSERGARESFNLQRTDAFLFPARAPETASAAAPNFGGTSCEGAGAPPTPARPL